VSERAAGMFLGPASCGGRMGERFSMANGAGCEDVILAWVGTSGGSVHWGGVLYPSGASPTKRLDVSTRESDTVESLGFARRRSEGAALMQGCPSTREGKPW
jgi:hypothetical protein